MATSDMLEKGLSEGLAAIKERMKDLNAEIKRCDDRVAAAQEERTLYYNRLVAAKTSSAQIRQRLDEARQDLEHINEKVKTNSKRLNERFLYTHELGKFNRSLLKEDKSHESIEELERECLAYTDILKDNHMRCRQLSLQLSNLTEELERSESKANEAERRRRNLEALVDNLRQQYSSKKGKSADILSSTMDKENNIVIVEGLLAQAEKRCKVSQLSLEQLTKRANYLESSIDDYRENYLELVRRQKEIVGSAFRAAIEDERSEGPSLEAASKAIKPHPAAVNSQTRTAPARGLQFRSYAPLPDDSGTDL